jgi:hypothetical protein
MAQQGRKQVGARAVADGAIIVVLVQAQEIRCCWRCALLHLTPETQGCDFKTMSADQATIEPRGGLGGELAFKDKPITRMMTSG